MEIGNQSSRNCYNETCDWDLRGIIKNIEKVFNAAPEIGLENIILRTWEKAGSSFFWISFFEHNRKTAKFTQTSNTPLEHQEVLDCGCIKSQIYSKAIQNLESLADLLVPPSRKDHVKIKSALKEYFGAYSVAKTYGVKNPYYGIKGFHKGNTSFLFVDEKSDLGERLAKAGAEEDLLMGELRKMSDAAGVGLYQKLIRSEENHE